MVDYTSQITAWYEAIQFRAPPAADLASFNAELNSGFLTTAGAISQIEGSLYTQTYVDPVIRIYQAALGRVPDQAGLSYWVNQAATTPNALANLATIFANSAEFEANFGAPQGAATPANPALVLALYENILGRDPTVADPAGLAYWESQPLTAAQLLVAFTQSAEFIKDTTPYVAQFLNTEITGTEATTGSLFNISVPGGVTTYNIGLGVPVNFTITGTLGGQTITGTVSGGPTGPITGASNVVINAPTGLNNFQNIALTGVGNVLNANYSPQPASNFTQSGLNLQGIQTWNIQADAGTFAGNSANAAYNTISFAGDAAVGNVISGIRTVNFNDNSGINSLLIGDNSEPVQEPTGANGLTINVSNAVGVELGKGVVNGVDIDLAAQAFNAATPGGDTINVGAHIVGGFAQLNGSYIIPHVRTRSPRTTGTTTTRTGATSRTAPSPSAPALPPARMAPSASPTG